MVSIAAMVLALMSSSQTSPCRYSIEGSKVLYLGKQLRGADARTFTGYADTAFGHPRYASLGADQHGYFVYDTRIEWDNAHTATVLAAYTHGECAFVVARGAQLFRINPNRKSVEPVTGCPDEPVTVVPSRHQTVSPAYYRGVRAVYFYDAYANQMTELAGAQPSTFRAFCAAFSFDLYWGIDSTGVYVGGARIDGADPHTFVHAGWIYGKDHARVYVITHPIRAIPGADPATFEAVKGRGVDAIDKNRSYFSGTPLGVGKRDDSGD